MSSPQRINLAPPPPTGYPAVVRRLFSWLNLCAGLALAAGLAFADPVDDLIKQELQAHQVAGIACLVVKDGRPIKTSCCGLANLEWNAPVTEDTVFEIGSVTKPFTASCILLLAQEGKLSVDDKISLYLTNTPPAWAHITLRHLLTHTSGLANYDGLEGFEMRRRMTQEQFIHTLAAYPLGLCAGRQMVLLQFRLQSARLHHRKRQRKKLLGFLARTNFPAPPNDQLHPPRPGPHHPPPRRRLRNHQPPPGSSRF